MIVFPKDAAVVGQRKVRVNSYLKKGALQAIERLKLLTSRFF